MDWYVTKIFPALFWLEVMFKSVKNTTISQNNGKNILSKDSPANEVLIITKALRGMILDFLQWDDGD